MFPELASNIKKYGRSGARASTCDPWKDIVTKKMEYLADSLLERLGVTASPGRKARVRRPGTKREQAIPSSIVALRKEVGRFCQNGVGNATTRRKLIKAINDEIVRCPKGNDGDRVVNILQAMRNRLEEHMPVMERRWDNSVSVRTVSGGLPGLGKRR
ncbi:hypothetical protein [Arthrobacter flavus]|uniref:Uncharacterized protein n=1 Tax=Arthrobacter flavus TaxID=95172 RepID=A0ABW4Q709_9MICC